MPQFTERSHPRRASRLDAFRRAEEQRQVLFCQAYAGMPELFFNWALVREKWVHYEFLDNSVPQGHPPRTIAFGQNGRLVIRDLDAVCNIDRFRHVNVDARDPQSVTSRTIEPTEALEFVRQCCARLDRVDFVDGSDDRIYARAEGRL